MGLVRVKNTWWGERRGLRLGYRNLEKIHVFPVFWDEVYAIKSLRKI